MSLTILSVAYPFTEVGPDATGGSEQVLTILDRTLIEEGHRSLVLAVEGSCVKGELIRTPKAPDGLNNEVRRWGRRVHQQLLFDALNRYSVDLVHMHALDFHTYLPANSIPTLATLHLPIDWYPSTLFLPQRRNFFLNCVSSSQEATCPPCDHLMPFVRNGIDVESYTTSAKRGSFVLGLGRICPEKGFHLALDAAKRANVRMILAGELFPYEEHQAYFAKEIEPRLDSQRQFVGPVTAPQKRKLLAAANALLVPSLVPETSSLVTMEALAAGTPVIAFPVGAIPELVHDGRNGFLASDVTAMAKAIARADSLEPAECRRTAADRCDSRAMGKEYLAMYARILENARRQPKSAVVSTSVSWLADVS